MEGIIMGFSWYYRTSEALKDEEIENSIVALKKFAKENRLRYLQLPQRAKQFSPEYVIYEGTYKKYWLGKVDPFKLRGILVIFPKPTVSEPLDFVPNSQKCLAFASCKTYAKDPENTMVEKMLRLLVQTTNGKLFAINDAGDLIGEPPEDWFTESNPEIILTHPTNEWVYHTKSPLEPQEIEDSINELTKFARKRNLEHVTLPSSFEQLISLKINGLAQKAYCLAEGTDRGSKAVNRSPQQLRGIIVLVNGIKFNFIPNKFRYIAFEIFESNGKQIENQLAEEMLQILHKTTHGKLYAHLDSKDGTKIIGELPEYHVKIKGVTNKRQEAF
jgi:hypothetical protein